ncbi:hypothetical protein B0T22DRAFT_451141 [Podospora appendiculata]|uniref:Suppressor of anucleate metulae protein B n=1 Tax=Podospora appendiculata TaxID=314037 RepID=A0AAE0XI73_9PEZI|nr:hypothetical protein B0T22DRAFT_451141 [Podospora appendiculata]
MAAAALPTAPESTRIGGAPGFGDGRSLIATRSFKPGEVIATFNDPLLALPDGPGMRTTCNFCLAVEVPLKACTGCKATVYCGAQCQRAHWKSIHKTECKMFKRVREQSNKDWLPTPVRALAQVLILLEAGEPNATAAFGDGGSLEGNVDGFRQDSQVWGDFQLQAAAALVYLGMMASEEWQEKARRGALDSDEKFQRACEVLCKIQTNAFNRLDQDTALSGIFLHPGLAMVNHSCMPNAFVGFDKRTAQLRAGEPIDEGDEIRISYIDYTIPRNARREALKLYHFECGCPRCTLDLDVYQACQRSPVIDLNAFSVQPDLQKLRDPRVDRSSISAAEIETVYKQWNSQKVPASDEVEAMRVTREQWKLCKPLVEARMWAVEPLPSTILQLMQSYAVGRNQIAYALPLACFLQTEYEPVRYVAPFMPWRIKGVMLIATMLSETAYLTARGELAKTYPHKGLVNILTKSDQLSMCEAMLRLVVHWARIGQTEQWGPLREAVEMLRDIESLEGRARESSLLRKWAKNPEDFEGRAFFQAVVVEPINALAALALEIVEGELGGDERSLVRR